MLGLAGDECGINGGSSLVLHSNAKSVPPFDYELDIALPFIFREPRISLTSSLIGQLRLNADRIAVNIDELIGNRPITVNDHEVTVRGANARVIVSILRRKDCPPMAPAIYYVHGGGYMFGDRFSGIDSLIEWVLQFNVVGLTVEYRLAPEYPHPAPIDDCYAGLIEITDSAGELGIDRKRLVLVGISSGGGLAAGLSLLARDKHGPEISGQLLISPMLDDRNDTVSARQFAESALWDRTSNETAWKALLGDLSGAEEVSYYAAPARAMNVTNMPSTYIECGSCETFRDEDVTYAARLWAAGVQAELHVWPGAFHGFDALAPWAALSIEARRARRKWLQRAISNQ